MKRNKRYIGYLILIISLIVFGILTGLKESNQIDNISQQDFINSNSFLKVYYLNVGEGDCIIVQQDNESMLIDAGNHSDSSKIKSYIDNLGIKSFNYVIGTHIHADHIGSMSEIIRSYDIKKFYFPKEIGTTKTFENLVDTLKEKKLNISVPEVGETFNLGTAECTVLAPNSTSYEDPNNYSIVLKITFGTRSFLFMGDAEAISEKEILKNNKQLLKADVLKIGHHGSKSSTSSAFLKAVSPTYAVISVGAENDYGHPNDNVLKRLKKNKVKVLRTDKNETIVATTDGTNLSID